MEWRFNDDRPIWQQLTEQLTLRILKGEYPPGSRLPAVRELAAQAGVNPNTMQRALAQLESDGLAAGGLDHVERLLRIVRIVEIIETYLGAFRSQFYRNRATQVAGAARHDGNFTIEFHNAL